MSAKIETAQVGSTRSPNGGMSQYAAGGLREVHENGLKPDAIETSTWAAGAGAASTMWLSWALETVPPALEHVPAPSRRNPCAD